MTTGLLTIGSSALDAAYTALQTTGNNIANVNTPGYSRELTSFSPQVQTNLGGMYIGSGVAVDAVSRVYSNFLVQQTNLAQAQSSQSDTTAQLTGQVNSLFGNAANNLGSTVDNLFTQIQALAAQPASAATRQTTLAAVQQVTDRFNGLAVQLQGLAQAATQQTGQQITSVNNTVAQIASLNDQIRLAAAAGTSPNSLLDQRAQDILNLNHAIGVSTGSQDDGSVNIYLANGQPLLIGDHSYALEQGPDPQHPGQQVVGTSVGGAIAALDPQHAGGGALGALLAFQSVTVPDVQNQIGRLAVTLAAQFNALQNLGVDANGAPGAKLFSVPAPSVTAASTNPDAASVNLGATVADPSKLQASDYQVQVQNGGYLITRLSDGTQTSVGTLPATVDGLNITRPGAAPAVGDVFTIQAVRLGASGLQLAIATGAQLAAASPVQATLGAGNGGSLTVSGLALAPLPQNPNPNLRQTVVVTFLSPTSYTLTPAGGTASAPQGYVAGQSIPAANGPLANGWTLTLGGTPAAGDVVTVGVGAPGAGDNRNALLMGQLQHQGVVAGATLDSAYAAVVADVGSTASTAQSDQSANAALLQSAQSAQSAVSGVNLDEEAAKLLQYQQQYQAAAKLIQTASTVFNTVLQVTQAA
jgi:flagellar hook-associated protein 1 FlgK